MMKKLIPVLIFLFLLPCLSNAQKIGVGITETINFDVLVFNYTSSIKIGEPFRVGFELHNTGSVGYKARVRLNVLNGSKILYTGWSQEESFIPGERHYFEIYYPVAMIGKFEARVRLYLANEIEEIKTVNFNVQGLGKQEDVVEIRDFETYTGEVQFILKSNETLKNVLVIPSDYPLGWIFEQRKIENLEKGYLKIVILPYEETLWKPSNVKIEILTEDGKYRTVKIFNLKKVDFIREFLHKLSSFLRDYLSIIL